MSNVIDKVVNTGLCCGCGVCSGICPYNALNMTLNRYGELVPEETGTCNQSCNVCESVCPFINGNPTEEELGKELFGTIDGIMHSNQCGYHLSTFTGYSAVNGQREHGASGGIATWLLENMLADGIVDQALCISPVKTRGRLFSYVFQTDFDGVRRSSGSAYYPVELSDALSHILTTPGRYVVTALPCVAKGLRMASRKRKVLRDRIHTIVGLTCGQMKNTRFTEYVSAYAGLIGPPQKVHYRGKDKSNNADNFFFSFQNDHDTKKIFWNSGPVEAWVNRWFSLNACRFCDDTFAELADITLMDAWLPEFVSDPLGTSMVIVRNPEIKKLLQSGKKAGTLVLHDIPIEKAIQSQTGVIEYKRRDLAYRLYRRKKTENIIVKRVAPVLNIGITARIRSRIWDVMQSKSRTLSIKYAHTEGFDARRFRNQMLPYLLILKMVALIIRIIHLPEIMVRKIMNVSKT